MTFLTMAFIMAYLAIGAYGCYRMGKEEFAKIPHIFKNEHPFLAVAYTGFLGFMFLSIPENRDKLAFLLWDKLTEEPYCWKYEPKQLLIVCS